MFLGDFMKALTKGLLIVAAVTLIANVSFAERTMRNSVVRRSIGAVCPAGSIDQIGSKYFYKNNKPIRAGSFLTAPVIGQNPVITLAGQKGGKGPRIFNRPGVLYSSNGVRITSLAPFPCRPDHCSGRVVSSMQTGIARRAAIRASGSPSGYIAVGGRCVFIPDIGRCFGFGVNMTRPLCNRTVT
jgi:hypothetical protein